MKKLLIILLLCFTFNSYAQLNKIGHDKYYHAGAGAIISASIFTIGQYSQREMNPIAPVLVVSFIGFGKETIDAMNNGNFSNKDLLWTITSGAAINLILYYAWDRKHLRHKKRLNSINYRY